MWAIFKVFIEFFTVLFLFYLLFFFFVVVVCLFVFGQEACGILTPWPGIKLMPPELEANLNWRIAREVPYSTLLKIIFCCLQLNKESWQWLLSLKALLYLFKWESNFKILLCLPGLILAILPAYFLTWCRTNWLTRQAGARTGAEDGG